MTTGTDVESELERLEGRIAKTPDSLELRVAALRLYLRPEWRADPWRAQHALEFVRRFPREYVARSPLVHLHPADAPGAFHQMGALWRAHAAAHPDDADILRGHASFLATHDSEQARSMLTRATHVHQDDGELWVDLAGLAESPAERLACLLEARRTDAEIPALNAQIVQAALAVGDLELVEATARELLREVDVAREAHGDRLRWRDLGEAMWARADSVCDTPGDASDLVFAIFGASAAAHWGHTGLGIVALRRRDVAAAKAHLAESADVGASPGLSSAGPSFLLARELFEAGERDAVRAYAEQCAAFWDSTELGAVIGALDAGMPPTFPNA
ncbi:MAG: hypothetical protein R3B40_28710 [Polyangiales bacterium]